MGVNPIFGVWGEVDSPPKWVPAFVGVICPPRELVPFDSDFKERSRHLDDPDDVIDENSLSDWLDWMLVFRGKLEHQHFKSEFHQISICEI